MSTPVIYLTPRPLWEGVLWTFGLVLGIFKPFWLLLIPWAIVSKKYRSKPKAYREYKKFLETTDLAEKEKFILSAASIFPSPFYFYEAARFLSQQDKANEAVLFWEKVVQAYPEPKCIYAFSEDLFHAGMHEAAITQLERIDEKNESEDFLDALLLKAECWIELRQFDRTLEAVKRILASRGDHTVDIKRSARLLRAKAYSLTGKSKEAIKELNQLAADAPDFDEASQLLTKIKADNNQ